MLYVYKCVTANHIMMCMVHVKIDNSKWRVYEISGTVNIVSIFSLIFGILIFEFL